MTNFNIGEEVLYEEERYIIAEKSPDDPLRFRLLACSPAGTKFIWASPQFLRRIASYDTSLDDTGAY